MNAIYVLWLRQLKRYVRSKARMIGSLGQPILFLVALGFGLGHIYQQANGGNYLDFIAPGVIAMAILFTAIFAGIEIIWDRQFGFLKETLVAPVSRFEIMLGRTFGGATVAVIQGIVVFIIASLIGFQPHFAGLPLAVLFMALVALLFTAMSTALASRMEDMQAFPLIMNFVTMPMFFLSGALFPLDGIPTVLKIIVKFNPFSYGVDGIRAALTGVSYFSVSTDITVLVCVTIVLLGLGSYMFSKIQI